MPFNAKDYRYKYKTVYHTPKKSRKPHAKQPQAQQPQQIQQEQEQPAPIAILDTIGGDEHDVKSEQLSPHEHAGYAGTNGKSPFKFYKTGKRVCAVCNHSFRTESQLFNHLDNGGKRLR